MAPISRAAAWLTRHVALPSAGMAVAGYGALTVKCEVTDAALEALTVTVASSRHFARLSTTPVGYVTT